MRDSTAIKVFRRVMKSLGDTNIAVRPGKVEEYDCKGVWEVGHMFRGSFGMDADIQPCEIEVFRPKRALSKRKYHQKVKGYRVTGYQMTHGSRWEPPDVEDFTIGEYESLSTALSELILYYVKERLSNEWEAAHYSEEAVMEKVAMCREPSEGLEQ